MSARRTNRSGEGDNTAIGHYLNRCRTRFAWIARLRIVATGLTTAAVLTIALAATAAYLVPSQGWIVAARILLYVVVATTVVACVVRRIGSRPAARRVERRVGAFDGGLITWLDARRRRRQPALLPQLAQTALAVANANPPRRAAPTWLLLPPLAVLAAVGLVLFLSFDAAPASWRLPAERLWLGDLFADTRPKIVVEPGDVVVPRGADVLVRARAHGFAAQTLAVNASFAGSGRWERAAMMPSSRDDYLEFVLVAVNEPVDYFVSVGGGPADGAASRFNSDRFRIEVADLPRVEGLEITLDYPAWTRLEPRTQDHGDVAGVDGTRVALRIEANLPLEEAHLVVNGEQRALDDDVGEFMVDGPGTWHVAVNHRGDVVRISDEYLIDLIHDAPPEVEFTFPGRDRSATAIEEVALRFRAADDFGIEALTLGYAVNGGDWSSLGVCRDCRASDNADGESGRLGLGPNAPPGREAGFVALDGQLNVGDREARASYAIFLENLAVGEEGRPIRPGDIVAFHAVAQDHRQSTKSALYFVDVRPFERHYRDTGTSSDGNGNSGGDREQELSSRQREIVNATWNLIQERDTGARASSDLRDQIDLVGVLQRTLREQVDTLVARTEGRRLSDNNEVEPYVAELTSAAAEMGVATAALANRQLDDAIRPEQRALTHLLTAEAGLRNVNVTLSNRSSGDSVSRSLSELFDLETDPEQNRYETPQTPGGGNEQESAEEEWRRLTELARRQEELARAQERNATEAPLSRWQLERLQRELDRLRERLADNAGQPSSGGEPQQDDGQRGASAASGAVAGGRPAGNNPPPETRGTIEDLDRAREAIERSLASEGANDAPQAAAEAFRQGATALRQAADLFLQDQQETLTQGIRDAERRAAALVEDQEGILQRLQALEQDVLRAVRQGEAYNYRGEDFDDEAQTKRRMRRDLDQIATDVSDLRQQLARSSQADAKLTRQLDRALDDLADSQVADQLTMAAEYLEMGRPLFIASRERRVHDALGRLHSRLGHVAERLETTEPDTTAPSGLAEVQALRRQLREVGASGDPQALGQIADATRRLAEAVLGAEGRLDLAETRRDYRGLGASDANRERLYRLTLAELDKMELALGRVEGVPIRAEEPRDEGYDSEAVARYFRHLSSGD